MPTVVGNALKIVLDALIPLLHEMLECKIRRTLYRYVVAMNLSMWIIDKKGDGPI